MAFKLCEMKMEPQIEKPPKIVTDPDVDCRLRHGLNFHCLAHIFQYLDTRDLFTLGEMNEFYEQIINNFIISNHNVNFLDFRTADQAIAFCRKHGTQIRSVHNVQLLHSDIRLIANHCSIGQLKSVNIFSNQRLPFAQLPIQFRDIQSFHLRGVSHNGHSFNANFSNNLHCLKLYHIPLHWRFDWTELMNLTELRLDSVLGINDLKFIEFARRRPKLKRFYLQKSLEHARSEVYKALARYCGDQIEVLHDRIDGKEIKKNSYDFLSGMKNLKEMGFLKSNSCSRNLIYAIQRLAENDTIERLVIHAISFCVCRVPPEPKIYLKPFTKLKTIRIHTGYYNRHGSNRLRGDCDRMDLLIKYSAEMLSNVQAVEVIIDSHFRDLDILKFVPKLRVLYVIRGAPSEFGRSSTEDMPKTISYLHDILRKRKTDAICDDFIELNVDDYHFEIFREIDHIADSIKLIRIPNYKVEQIKYRDTIRLFGSNVNGKRNLILKDF